MSNLAHFRPLGSRVLVKRLPKPDTTVGGLYVIHRLTHERLDMGKDKPTLGTVLAHGPAHHCINRIIPGDLVQFRIGANFDAKDLDDEHLLLDYDDLNVRISRGGLAFALGNRVMIRRASHAQEEQLLRHHTSLVVLRDSVVARYALGYVVSVGEGAFTRKRLPGMRTNNVEHRTTVVFDPYKASELTLAGQDYLVTRDEDCLLELNNGESSWPNTTN